MVLARRAAVPAKLLSADPWFDDGSWRITGLAPAAVTFLDGEISRTVWVHGQGDARSFEIDGKKIDASWTVDCVGANAWRLEIVLGQQSSSVTVVIDERTVYVFEQGQKTSVIWIDPLFVQDDSLLADTGGLTAPMPGKIIAVHVQAGAVVKRGQALLVMEAMKMEHTINATTDGVVSEVFFFVGDQVSEGVALLSMEGKA